MNIYGIGASFSHVDVLQNFIENNCVAVGYSEESAPPLFAMQRDIQLGDIIYVKSFTPNKKRLFIKAIGRVEGYPTTSHNISDEHLKDQPCIPVKWLYLGDVIEYGLNSQDYTNNVYSHTLYREYSPNVIKIIMEHI